MFWNNGKKKEDTALVPTKKETALTPVMQGGGIQRAGEIAQPEPDDVIYERKSSNISLAQGRGVVVQVRSKSLRINGEVHNIDPRQLIRMIKQVTQTIGEYKNKDNPYSAYAIGALRKSRSDMVSDLEHHFNIFWEIDEGTGKSIFYMG